MNAITDKLSEQLYDLYENVKPRKKKVDKSGTLCWRCQHAVPTGDGSRGCEWSLFNEPVPGWDAIPRKIPCSYGNYSRFIKTFHVKTCPRFMED